MEANCRVRVGRGCRKVGSSYQWEGGQCRRGEDCWSSGHGGEEERIKEGKAVGELPLWWIWKRIMTPSDIISYFVHYIAYAPTKQRVYLLYTMKATQIYGITNTALNLTFPLSICS